jgi:hypothetical protein
MILGAHREAFVARIGRRPSRDGPADKDAIDLQTKVKMFAPREMALDDQAPARSYVRARRLRGFREIAFGAVDVELRRGGLASHQALRFFAGAFFVAVFA